MRSPVPQQELGNTEDWALHDVICATELGERYICFPPSSPVLAIHGGEYVRELCSIFRGSAWVCTSSLRWSGVVHTL